MAKGKLNQQSLDGMPIGMHLDGDGLYLQVKGATSRSWVFRYTMKGQARWLGLGSVKDVTLAKARDRRDDERHRIRRGGVDVVAEKRIQRDLRRTEAVTPMTFREAAAQTVAAKRAEWGNEKHAIQWTATLTTYAYPKLGHLPVQSIDTPMVLGALSPIWQTKPETARRVRGRIEATIAWATVNGHRTGDNPARWHGHLEHALSKRPPAKHHPALPYGRAFEFMVELQDPLPPER
jgi:hypothetical protein